MPPQPTEYYCADVSREAGEPLVATAPDVQTWFLLQYDAAWEPKAIKNNNLPAAVKTHLNAALESIPGARMLFIRQQPRQSDDRLAFFVVRANSEPPTSYAFSLGAYEDLLELDLHAVANGAPEYAPQHHTEPLFLVCTHGKRDKCCARYGLPVYDALRALEGDTVWQSSHVSGHRFAANIVCFPHGVYYGRVFPADLEKLATAYRAGHVNPAFYRGRAGDTIPAQAAEYFVRRETGLTALDALYLDATQPLPDGGWQVGFITRDGARHTVILAKDDSDFGVFLSCTDDEVCAVPQYKLVRHEAHPA